MAGPFRVIIVGDSSVGKTAISHRCVENVFYSEHVPTLGVDFKYCTFSADETGASQPIRLAVWDSAGQETFLSITQQFIRGADAAFLCYDITDTKSYQNAISNWRERIAGEKGGNIKMLDLLFLSLQNNSLTNKLLKERALPVEVILLE